MLFVNMGESRFSAKRCGCEEFKRAFVAWCAVAGIETASTRPSEMKIRGRKSRGSCKTPDATPAHGPVDLRPGITRAGAVRVPNPHDSSRPNLSLAKAVLGASAFILAWVLANVGGQIAGRLLL